MYNHWFQSSFHSAPEWLMLFNDHSHGLFIFILAERKYWRHVFYIPSVKSMKVRIKNNLGTFKNWTCMHKNNSWFSPSPYVGFSQAYLWVNTPFNGHMSCTGHVAYSCHTHKSLVQEPHVTQNDIWYNTEQWHLVTLPFETWPSVRLLESCRNKRCNELLCHSKFGHKPIENNGKVHLQGASVWALPFTNRRTQGYPSVQLSATWLDMIVLEWTDRYLISMRDILGKLSFETYYHFYIKLYSFADIIWG